MKSVVSEQESVGSPMDPAASDKPNSTGFLKDRLPKLGLRNFWYPAAKSSQIREQPIAITLLGEEVAFYRDAGKVYALHNRCPHRGLPFSEGKRHFPGTISCGYHGWTFDTDGICVAALNEGPCSRLPGRVRVRTYPIEERNGLVWIYMGDDDPRPIEDDIPPELLDETSVIYCQTEVWNCSWLPGLENLLDTHDLFVHRNSIFFFFKKIPAWAEVSAVETSDGKGISYGYKKIGPLQDVYPKVGMWPPRVWWRRFNVAAADKGEYLKAELRLPGVVRVGFSSLMYVRVMVPINETESRAFMFSSRKASGWRAAAYRIYYHMWASWSLLTLFINQDTKIFQIQDYEAPEQLAASDIGLVKWRRLILKAHEAALSIQAKSKGIERNAK